MGGLRKWQPCRKCVAMIFIIFSFMHGRIDETHPKQALTYTKTHQTKFSNRVAEG